MGFGVVQRSARAFLPCCATISLLAAHAAMAQAPDAARNPTVPAATDSVHSSQLPDTHAGKVLSAMLTALNSQDIETLRTFVRHHYASFWFEGGRTVDMLASGLLRYAQEGGGGFEVVEFISRGPLLIGAKAKTARGAHYAFSINVTEKDPTRIGMLMIAPTDSSSTDQERPVTDDEMVKRLDRFLSELAANDQFSGSVLIAKNGKPIFTKAVGLASKSYEVPNRVDTKFSLASMNKMFTAVAISQLVERGKLSFDDTVGKLLPDYPNSDAREKVTIKHLLSHTSGLGGDIFSQERFDSSPLRYWSVGDVVATFANEPMEFEPGERMQYCNAGFQLLGQIVEVASGLDYYEYVRQNIYKPALMDDTDSYASDEVVRNLATGYTHNRLGDGSYFCKECNVPSDGRAWYSTYGKQGLRGGPAGGGYSTVEDLTRFVQALTSGKLLKPETVRLLTSGKVEMPNVPEGRAEYGYGFMIVTTPSGSKYFGHGGTYWGVSTDLRHYPDLGYTVVVLSNYDLVARVVANRIDRLLPSKEP